MRNTVIVSLAKIYYDLKNVLLQFQLGGHGELLKLRLLEKSARHDFIIARQRSNNNINF